MATNRLLTAVVYRGLIRAARKLDAQCVSPEVARQHLLPVNFESRPTCVETLRHNKALGTTVGLAILPQVRLASIVK